MNSVSKNKKLIIFITVCAGSFLAYIWFVFYGLNSLSGGLAKKVIKQGVFNTVNPQKTTVRDLEKKFGKPAGKEIVGDTGTLYYDSKQKYQYEYVWTKNGSVIATKERVPQDTKKEYFTKDLGPSDITLYDKDIIPATWLVFLDNGVAIRIADDTVYVLVRFAPQSKESFLNNIAPVAGMTTEKLKPIPEPG